MPSDDHEAAEMIEGVREEARPRLMGDEYHVLGSVAEYLRGKHG